MGRHVSVPLTPTSLSTDGPGADPPGLHPRAHQEHRVQMLSGEHAVRKRPHPLSHLMT